MQRTLFCKGQQPYVIREAMLNSVTSSVIDSHPALRKRFSEVISGARTCHSFAVPVPHKDKKVNFAE